MITPIAEEVAPASPASSSASPPLPNGGAVAAYLSAMIGLLTLGIIVFVCEASKTFTGQVHALGKLWIPGAEEIGPYSGKETLMLVSWLGSWAILHLLLRKRELNGGLWLTVFVVGIGAASTLVWPPVWHFFLGGH